MPIQIIPAAPRKPNMSERLNSFMNQGMQFGEQIMQQQQAKNQMQQENEQFHKLTGMDISGIQDPKMRQEAFATAMQGDLQRQKYGLEAEKLKGSSEVNERNYNDIKNTFGEKFANVWRASEPGAQTELVKNAIDSISRGENIQNYLQQAEPPEPSQMNQEQQKIPQMNKGKISPEMKWPDYTKRPDGYTKKDWVDLKKDWRKENVPIFDENKKKLDNTNQDILATKKLKSLSEKLPEGLERAIINPETGELYGVAQLVGLASPEVQEWVKTISRFQNRAKDAFGSRVTNFDLMSYMKQFPGLLNTKEGRNRIIRMMEINYDLDKLYSNSLNQVYQHYGLGNIPQEEAEKLARGMIENESDRLHTEYLGHDAQNQSKQDKQNGLSGRMIDIIGPDGQEYEVDESELEQLPEGFRVI